jgi:hypothetical protein
VPAAAVAQMRSAGTLAFMCGTSGECHLAADLYLRPPECSQAAHFEIGAVTTVTCEIPSAGSNLVWKTDYEGVKLLVQKAVAYSAQVKKSPRQGKFGHIYPLMQRMAAYPRSSVHQDG